MKNSCSKCGGDSLVVDIVRNPEDNEVYRKRKCKSCGRIFYTVEYEIEKDSIKTSWNKHYRTKKNK